MRQAFDSKVIVMSDLTINSGLTVWLLSKITLQYDLGVESKACLILFVRFWLKVDMLLINFSSTFFASNTIMYFNLITIISLNDSKFHFNWMYLDLTCLFSFYSVSWRNNCLLLYFMYAYHRHVPRIWPGGGGRRFPGAQGNICQKSKKLLGFGPLFFGRGHNTQN